MHIKHQVLVTPDQAREWLEFKNLHNRPVTQRTVQRYAQEMRNGKWKLNAESLKFGKSGNLLDGQHRLKACVESGVSFETAIAFGVEDSTFDTLDDGNPRRLADVLAIRGERHARHIAPALYFVYSYATGTHTTTVQPGRKNIATKQILEKLLETQSGIRNSARYYHMLRQRPGGLLLPASLSVGLHYIFSLVDSQLADDFFDRFQSGVGLQSDDPVYLLRARLITGAREAASAVKTESMYIYTVIAWNAVRSGKKLTRIQLPPAGTSVEIADVPRSLMKELL